MKRFLISLLAALALPSIALSGDLGTADFDIEKRSKRYRTEEYRNMALQDTFNWYCGTAQKKGGEILLRKECKVEFKNGKLKVDGSKGILPSQVIQWSSNGQFLYPLDSRKTDLNIYYKNGEGKITSASFGARGSREGMAFYLRFLSWMNNGK